MRKIITKLAQWYKKHSFVSVFFIFALAAALFVYLQATPFFADPDSFYHAKMAVLTKENGIIKDFHWLGRFTVLGKDYINQHFLYHVALVPFVSFLDPLVGIKVATVLFASILVALFAGILKKFGVKGAWLYGVVLLISNPFTFRMSLAKAPSFSIIFLLIGIYFLWSKKYRKLFAWSFLYVWAYGGFALLAVMGGIYCFVSILWKLLESRDTRHNIDWRSILKSEEVKIMASIGFGMILGIMINPYFPTNLKFYKSQLIDIGIINYQNEIGVGGEWYPYALYDVIPATFMVSILTVIGIILMAIYHKKQTTISMSAFFNYLFFLFLTLKSRRYIEYYVPMATLFSAIAIATSIQGLNWRKHINNFIHFYAKHQIACMALGIYVFVMIPAIIVKDIQVARNDLEDGIRFDKFTKSMEWLKNDSKQGDLIFHCDWDEFPVLFYRNSKNDYIAGLDPTFIYKFNKDRYWEWAKITKGETADNLHSIVKNNFNAQYVFLEKDHTAMDQNISLDPGFILAYEDEESKIYKVE